LWDEVEAHVIQMGAAECDSATLAGMCRWYDEYRRLANQLARTAVLDVAYRQVQVAASLAWQRFVETAGKFGLTPADRARLKTNIEERRGALDEMLARRQA
jgi:phage terminase small subunit